MLAVSQEERKALEEKARIFLKEIKAPETSLYALINLIEPVVVELNNKSDRQENKEILIEIKNLREDMNKRFEAVDKRFEDMYKYMDKRFEDMYKYMDKRFAMLQWFMGLGFTLVITLITILIKL